MPRLTNFTVGTRFIVSATIMVTLWLIMMPVHAQEPVTADDVDAIAEQMFCPICENEPLDDCQNVTCIQWKEEIAEQLGEGRTAEEIINYFVEGYGQQVVGVPQDPLLRGLSLFTPLAVILIIAGFGIWTFRRWQTSPTNDDEIAPDAPQTVENQEEYRAQLERDLL